MKCAVCGKPIPDDRPDLNLYFYICSPECQRKFNAKVDEIFRQRHGNLIGKSLIIDPYVGDEYEIARISAKDRIEAELSRHVRLENLRENMNRYGLPTKFAEHVMMLVESAAGANYANFKFADKFYCIFYGGSVKPIDKCCCYWKRMDDGWVEILDGEVWKVIRDSDMRYPHFGDVEGALAINLIEHMTPEDE